MPRLVQSPALGLLSLFTCKDGGIGPNSLADEYRATVDARPLLGFGFRRTFTITQTAGQLNAALGGLPGWIRLANMAAGITAGFRCPDNQIWKVLGFGATIQTVTGSTSLQVGWDFPAIGGVPGDPFMIAESNQSTTGGAAGNQRTAGFFGNDLWAGPGQGPAIHMGQWLIGTNDCDLVGACLAVEAYRI